MSSTTRKPTKIGKQSRTSIPSFKVCFHFRELLANRKSRVGAPFCRCFAKLLLQHTCNNQIECRERCCARQIAYKVNLWGRSKTLCKSRLTMHTGTPHSKQMICLTQGLPSRNVFQVGSHVEISVVFQGAFLPKFVPCLAKSGTQTDCKRAPEFAFGRNQLFEFLATFEQNITANWRRMAGKVPAGRNANRR